MAKTTKPSITSRVKRTSSKIGSRMSNTLGSTMQHITDTKTEGVGTYVKASGNKYSSFTGKRTIQGLKRGQAYKLEKQALKNEALKINAKPEMIRAIGSAFAQNTVAPTASLGASYGAAKATNLFQNNNTNVSSLISGGANVAGKNNDEETESIQDQFQIR